MRTGEFRKMLVYVLNYQKKEATITKEKERINFQTITDVI